MPIQNVGTLIENLVVTEAAAVLLDCVAPGQSLGFATAFAMPPLSEWRPHNQAVGMSTNALQGIRNSSGGTDFLEVMRACLLHSVEEGPSGTLLVGLLAALRGKQLQVWANDIEEGHYGNAIPALEQLEATVRNILPSSGASLKMSVCSTPYPDSINDLKEAIARWRPEVDVVLGFLDPMRYVREPRGGPYTSSPDHRQWLRALRSPRVSLAVQFTGNSDYHSLSAELSALRSDLEEMGFPFSIEVRRQHYVVSVGSRTPDLLDLVEAKTRSSWNAWCNHVSEIKNRQLDISRNLPAAG